MYQKYTEVLEKSPLFQGIDQSSMFKMLNCIKPQIYKYPKDSILAIEGDPIEGVYIILEGSVTISRETAEGNRIILSILDSGSMFGEMAAFTLNSNWPATVSCNSRVEVLVMPMQSIVGMCASGCEGHRSLIINMLRILAEKATGLNRRVEYLSIKTIRGKVARMLMDLYDKTHSPYVRVHMNRNQMADFLGVTRPSLSRELSNMQEEGLLEYMGKEFKLKELETLRYIMYN